FAAKGSNEILSAVRLIEPGCRACAPPDQADLRSGRGRLSNHGILTYSVRRTNHMAMGTIHGKHRQSPDHVLPSEIAEAGSTCPLSSPRGRRTKSSRDLELSSCQQVSPSLGIGVPGEDEAVTPPFGSDR